jgi:ABC-2 type transport system ATP-binding protein
MGDVLTITGACKRFGGTRALDGADLSLGRGEWLGLLGPNGAGKTTLVRSVTGRVRLDDGVIALEGKLGVVPQDIAIYPLMTARENLEIFGALNGLRGDALKDRVRWALEWSGLVDRSNQPTKRFSGGMRRRLNIACGILHQPDVILLDEPTVGVDPQSRQRIWEMLSELQAGGASMLMTTHQLDEAERLCDRIVIIDHGKAIASGTLGELIDQTIGRSRQVTIQVRGAPAEVHSVRDVAGELPGLLSVIDRDGRTIDDVRIEAPTLHAVFIHLTGRELRE